MPKGPLGGPRPKSEYRIILDPQEKEIFVIKVGPFGFPRPFAKNNPPIEDDEIAECMMSNTGRKFGAGYISDGSTTDMDNLTPEEQQRALEITEKYCEGVLEGTAIEDIERGEAIPVLSRIRATLQRQTGSADSISLEMLDVDESNAEELG